MLQYLLLFLLATEATATDVLSTCPTSTFSPSADFTCPSPCTCLINVTNVYPNIQLKAEENSTMIVNFNAVASGIRWTIQSSGKVTVYCNYAGSCENLRLLGENINAHCIGTTSCNAVDCEGASAHIVECYGYFTCEDCDTACDVPSATRVSTQKLLPSTTSMFAPQCMTDGQFCSFNKPDGLYQCCASLTCVGTGAYKYRPSCISMSKPSTATPKELFQKNNHNQVTRSTSNSPKTTCKQIGNDPKTCDATQGCVFCTGGWANTHGCYTNDAASRLPPGMFQCDSDSDDSNIKPTTTQFPSSNISLSFSSSTNQKCDLGFPGCVQNMNKGYTIDMAINDVTFMETYGPTSMLPTNENNQLINRYDTGMKYAMWINGKGSNKKIINCTRYNISGMNMTRSRLREAFLGYSFRSSLSTTGQVPCSSNSTRFGDCDEWIWNSEFGCTDPSGAFHVGQEPEKWRVSSNNVLTGLTNDIYYPKICLNKYNKQSHIAASIDYTENWSANPAADVFDVPSDGDCPLVDDVDVLYRNVHPSLLLFSRRVERK